MKILKKYEEFLNEENNLNLDINVSNPDNEFINKLIDKLSFVYQKRKSRYLRPFSITGSMNDEINLTILLNNKDIIVLKYKDKNLEIKINDEIVYDMEDVEKQDIVSKIIKYIIKKIENEKFKINSNPFEN